MTVVPQERRVPPVSPRGALERALASPDPAVQRLPFAATSVRFVFEAADPVVLLLDREPPAVAAGDAGAEIEVTLDREQAEQFVRGRLNIPVEAAEGNVACRGPVRKYLLVDAVLRGLLRSGVEHADG